MILITGATGNIGRFLVPELLERKEQVRVLVRDRSKAEAWAGQADIAVGDLSAPDTLGPALADVKSVFLLAGPSGDALAQARNVVEAARLAGSQPHVVLVSSLGADDPSVALAKVHADREALVVASGLPWTMLRPGMFMTNTFAWARTIRAQKTVFNPYAQGSISPIAPADIAHVAAATLGRIVGFALTCQDISIEQSVEGMVKNGYPEFVAQMLGELNRRVRNTAKSPVFDTVSSVTGHPATTFEAWVQENSAVWS